jgi:ribosomal subunit interface protein
MVEFVDCDVVDGSRRGHAAGGRTRKETERPMTIDVHVRHLHVTPEDLEHARRRVELALDRWADRITEVGVEMSDTNGRRGGPDKHVRVHALLDGRATIRAEDTDASLDVAVDRATTRLKAGVRHHAERHSREERRRQTRAAG